MESQQRVEEEALSMQRVRNAVFCLPNALPI